MNFKEIEKTNNAQICLDVNHLNNGSESVVFNDGFENHKALLVADTHFIPCFVLNPVVQNRTEYDVYKVKTPKEANINNRWFYYAVKNNSYVNEKFEVVR